MDDRTRRAWLEARRTGIGGSDAAAILGISPWTGPYAIYQSKVSPLGEDKPIPEPMYWGSTLESVVADEFAKRSGFVVYEQQRPLNPDGSYPMLRHPEYPFMTASVDRYICTTCPTYGEHLAIGHKPDSFLECKTARAGQETKWDAGVPPYYYAQVQHYLAVLGMEYCYVACLIGGSVYVTHKVERNDEYIRELIEAEAAFWKRVETRNPPPPDDSPETTELLNSIPAEAGKSTELVVYEAFGILHSLKEVKDTIATLEAQKRRLENELKEKLGEAEYGYVDGKCLVSWKTQTRTGLDASRLWEELPDVAKKYATVSTFRVLRVQEVEAYDE